MHEIRITIMKVLLSRFALVPALLAALASPALAADAAGVPPAAETAKTLCAGCHGADGKTPIDPSYAIIAGQYADYLEVALKAYKRGDRTNAIMGNIAKGLSDAQIEGLAEYFAALPGPLGYRR